MLPRQIIYSVFFFMIAGNMSLRAGGKGTQVAIVKKIQTAGKHSVLVLDFVEIRDCNCDSGFEIVNQNPKLRKFKFTGQSKIWLLKNAGEYREATLQDFLAGRSGKDFGWRYDADNPFEFRFDVTGKIILEMRQVYLP